MNDHIYTETTETVFKPFATPTFCMFSQHSNKDFREFVIEQGVDYII